MVLIPDSSVIPLLDHQACMSEWETHPMPKRIRKRARPARPRGHYQPTPIAGLVLYPTVLLLNLIVRTAEDNGKMDGIIPTRRWTWSRP